MNELAGGDFVRIKLLSSSQIEQFCPDARKISRSAVGQPHRELL
jgi:hypothetical protein